MAAADKPRSSKVVEGDYHEPEFIHIVVSDAQRVGDYITYKITTSTTFPEYKSREFSVRRRYKEFVWLRDHLKQKLAEKPKAIKFGELAPLPGDTLSSLFGKGRFDPEFIEDRRKKLESFLVSVANHNYFRFIPALHDFLQNTNANAFQELLGMDPEHIESSGSTPQYPDHSNMESLLVGNMRIQV